MKKAQRQAGVSNENREARGIDFIVENHFSIFLLRPLTSVGRRWLDSNVADNSQWFGNALVCEWRYVAPIVNDAIEEGLVVE